MSHPNIVEIFESGEFEDEGKKKPYFVMPLLPCTTLDHFVRTSSYRLTVEIISWTLPRLCWPWKLNLVQSEKVAKP
jgi:serine/threonine protein kinase